MSKSKLNEYCQRNKLPSPQYITTGVSLSYTCTITIFGVKNLTITESIQYTSKDTQISKKKAENEACNVVLEEIEIYDKNNKVYLSLEEENEINISKLILSIRKLCITNYLGIFDTSNVIPAEFLLLYQPVQACLNRISSTYRKDSTGAFEYLLKALCDSKQISLSVNKHNNRILLTNNNNSSSDNNPDNNNTDKNNIDNSNDRNNYYNDDKDKKSEIHNMKGNRTLKNEYKKAVTSKIIIFVIIPSSPLLQAYEKEIILEGSNENVNNKNNEKNENEKNRNEKSKNGEPDDVIKSERDEVNMFIYLYVHA